MEKRPAGITILSFIYILIAVMGLTTNLSMPSSSWFATATFLVLAISAIGFFMGQKWAWWIIGTMTLFSIINNVPQLILVIKNADIIPEIQKYYLKYGGKLVIQGLILLFMFSQPVINFFALENIKKAKLFLILIAAAAVLFLIFYLL